jgi:hypothetical protein
LIGPLIKFEVSEKAKDGYSPRLSNSFSASPDRNQFEDKLVFTSPLNYYSPKYNQGII